MEALKKRLSEKQSVSRTFFRLKCWNFAGLRDDYAYQQSLFYGPVALPALCISNLLRDRRLLLANGLASRTHFTIVASLRCTDGGRTAPSTSFGIFRGILIGIMTSPPTPR